MYDEEGYIYAGRTFFDGYTPHISDCVGRIDSNGYVYRGRYTHESECVGMIDSDGKVYEGRGWFHGSTPTTSPIGYVHDNGCVYNEVGFFNNRDPNSFPVAYVDDGWNMRTAGAAVLLLLTDSNDGYGDSGYSGGRSSGGSGFLGSLGMGILLIVAVVFVVSLFNGKFFEWRAEVKEEKRIEEQTREERANFYSVNDWIQHEDGNWSYSGYFGEYATKDSSNPDFRVNDPAISKMTVNLVSVDPGLEVKLTVNGRRSDRDRTSSEIPCGETFSPLQDERYTIHVERISGTGFFTFEVILEE